MRVAVVGHVEWVEFVDVHSGDERIEHVLTAHDPIEGPLDARLRPPVLELAAVHRGEDDRFDRPAQEDRRRDAADAEKFRSVELHDCGSLFAIEMMQRFRADQTVRGWEASVKHAQ